MSAADRPADTHRYRSFVALGDSFTEGLQDDLGPEGRHRGWADRVAAALAVHNDALAAAEDRGRGVRYANLAVRGRLLDAVVREQLPVAEALAPDLVSFQAAGNDILRLRVDLPGVLARYEQAVGRLRVTGADVLLFTVVSRTGGSGRTADLLAARFGAFNAHVRDVAARHGCAVADLGAARALQDRRFWHEDRLHLGPTGHERVAAAALEALGLTGDILLGGPPGWWRDPLPVRPPAGRRRDLVDDVRWVHRHFLPWVSRRLRGVSSGDGLSPKHVELVDVLPPPHRV
jgi:lysophospholipase L1-like esterase